MTARRPSYKLTFEDAVQIHLRIQAGELQSRIAADYDVNGGRISEVNTGKLHPGSADVARQRYGSHRAA
ncbi:MULTISPECIES: hypothetical protein [Chelatococcus]|uniref:hypothetical protein n=1 Tax=Chelatococcus TaxID=28209 RepID=UPI000903D3CB|nr:MULTISPECIES: hypothetical protein [Chelatococcus]